MVTLATAFALAWLAVVAYLAWLGRKQRQLYQKIKALEAELEGAVGALDHTVERPRSLAA